MRTQLSVEVVMNNMAASWWLPSGHGEHDAALHKLVWQFQKG